MSTYIGIDPGMSGGIAVLSDAAPPVAYKMPETERDVWDLFLSNIGPEPFAMIEKVSAMPKQGLSSTFKFGKNYGMLRGMLVAACCPVRRGAAWRLAASAGLPQRRR